MRHSNFMTSVTARIKGKNKICSGKVYGTLCTGIHNLPTRKKRRKTGVAQANSKVTFHTVMSL